MIIKTGIFLSTINCTVSRSENVTNRVDILELKRNQQWKRWFQKAC